MTVTVTKAGPYYASGEIKFSDLRRVFRAQQRKQTSSGSETFNTDTASISATELLRVTDTTETNPIVPDSTENSNISTSNNLKLSQFRNSIKYYYITQSGTDENFDIAAQSWNTNLDKNINKFMFIDGTCGSNSSSLSAAQLNATAYNLIVDTYGSILGAGGKGVGVGGFNVTKSTRFNHIFDNIPTWSIEISTSGLSIVSGDLITIFANIDDNGSSRSYNIDLSKLGLNSTSYTISVTNTNQSAAGDFPGIGVNAIIQNGFNINLTFKNLSNNAITFARDFIVTVSGTSGFSGDKGGDALSINSPDGNNIVVFVRNVANIYGGGGGGEKGATGASGSSGTCTNYTTTSGCGGAPGCPAGYSQYNYSTGGCCQSYSYCCGLFNCACTACSQYQQTRYCSRTTSVPGAPGGVGGNGGSGQGYNQTKTNGVGGVGGTPGGCPSYGGTGNTGEPGGNGGDWGMSGGNTTNEGSGGTAGRAIVGSKYVVDGTISSTTIKGSYQAL